MAKRSKETADLELDSEEKGGKISGFFLALIIIVIWLVIFGLLIKMDVGGFGSTVLRPLLKDIPVISAILPAASDDEVLDESGYRYKNLAEAVERIKQLETELEAYRSGSDDSAEQIRDLVAEVARLRIFEQNQLNFEEMKKKFDEEVVFNNKAPDINEYKEWYENISPENAAELYEKVIKQISYSQQVKDWASAYSRMDAASAARILQEMTGDMDLVSQILLNMTAQQRGNILAEMDPVFAGKITKIMYPE